MSIKLQVIRKGSKYESYRISIPKPIVEGLDLANKEFELKIEKGKLILIPQKKS